MARSFTTSTLNYPSFAPSPINRVEQNRAPTSDDYKNFQKGDEWLDLVSNDWYKFIKKTSPTSGLWVRIGGTGGPAEDFIVDAGTSPVEPNAANEITFTGAQVAAGTVGANVLRSNGTGSNTLTYQIQRTAAVAASDSTNNGVAHFDSSMFSVDANGFVQLAGSGLAVDSLGVQSTSGTGVNPVVPDGAGTIEIEGAAVAATSIPIQSQSTLPNNLQIQIQRASVSTGTNTTSQGIASFDDNYFTADANGYISLVAGVPSIVWTDQGSNTSVASFSGSFSTATITLVLPASPSQGDTCEFCTASANALTVQAASTHLIRIGTGVSSAGGTATSTPQPGESMVLVYRSADTTWYAVPGIQGVWTLA